MKKLVIYHDHCTDGFGAAYAAWLKFGDDADYVGATYGQEFDVSTVDNREVYILDFSFPLVIMHKIFELSRAATWLDHHKTAFEMWCPDGERNRCEQSNGLDYVLLDNNKSGALLAWEYFHPDLTVPSMIAMIDDRDRWQFKIADSKAFHAGMNARKPWSFGQWGVVADDAAELARVIDVGRVLLSRIEQEVAGVVKRARKCDIVPAIIDSSESYKKPWTWNSEDQCHAEGLSVNACSNMSEVGHELAVLSGTYGMVWYVDQDNTVKVSLRSNGEYDVSAIAKTFGGGGHRNAAGFSTHIDKLKEMLA